MSLQNFGPKGQWGGVNTVILIYLHFQVRVEGEHWSSSVLEIAYLNLCSLTVKGHCY